MLISCMTKFKLFKFGLRYSDNLMIEPGLPTGAHFYFTRFILPEDEAVASKKCFRPIRQHLNTILGSCLVWFL